MIYKEKSEYYADAAEKDDSQEFFYRHKTPRYFYVINVFLYGIANI